MSQDRLTSTTCSLVDRVQSMDHVLTFKVLAYLLSCCPISFYDCARSGRIGRAGIRSASRVAP